MVQPAHHAVVMLTLQIQFSFSFVCSAKKLTKQSNGQWGGGILILFSTCAVLSGFSKLHAH